MFRALVFMCVGMFAIPSLAQDTSGEIDTRKAINRRIFELEGMISGDVSAEKQAVTLRWLADLYIAAGRIDDAEYAYERILVHFPYDVASCNAYAEFLLDTRKNPEKALEVTHDTILWSQSAPSPPPYLGETYALRARAFADAGQCENAMHAAGEAVSRSEEDAAEDARRTQARCVTISGDEGQAKKILLGVIGDTEASSPDDKSALIALLTKKNKRVDTREVDREIARAIDESRKRRAKELEREGASMVDLAGADRVRLEATLRAGEGKAAVLFVPDGGGRRSTFTPYAQLFTLDGFTAMTLDPRGHGHSRADSLPSFDAMPEHHRLEVPSDVATAFDYLTRTRRIDPSRIVVVAAGTGCGAVERAMHEHNLAPAVVYLSPIFASDDRELATAFSFRPKRPALVLASDEDTYAVMSLRAFRAAFPDDDVQTKTYKSAGHGVSLLRDPAHFADVDAWIKQTIAK